MLPREKFASSVYAIYSASATYSYETLNAALLSMRPYDAFVSTRAENQTIDGVKTFTSTAVFQGTVGIGTGTPTALLSLYKPNSGGGAYGLRVVGPASANDIPFSVYDGGGVDNILTVKGSGQIGIGTTNPERFIHIKTGSLAAAVRIDNSATNGRKWDIGDGTVSNGRFSIIDSTAGSERLSINSAGEVSINNLSGTGNRAVYSDPSGILTNSSSDIRLKKNIEGLSGCLEKLMSLRGVRYNWNTSVPRARNLGNQREIGMIAQEVEKFFPELVGEDSDGYKSIDYAKFVAVLLEAIKEQQNLINILQQRIEKLEEDK